VLSETLRAGGAVWRTSHIPHPEAAGSQDAIDLPLSALSALLLPMPSIARTHLEAQANGI